MSSTSGLNVIALISGGKDSLYSILHCIRNGHKVIALANLHPETKPEDGNEEEDIDSFMYQTIGHSVIPLYESALEIPLYRAAITGGAVDTSRIYQHDSKDQSTPQTDLDETESLVPLLQRIKNAHPEANAISAGAILSTYQRTRIENIAARLNLVPLAWLWMYPSLPAPVARDLDPLAISEAGLLEDMAAVGCDARIIKVASGGLDDGFLWENLSGSGNPGRGLRRRVTKNMRRFVGNEDIRGAVLGEGGEYETLALDGPGFLWKKRIEIEKRDVGVAEGGVAFLRLKDATCVEKVQDEYTPDDVRRPALLNPVFRDLLQDVAAAELDEDVLEFKSAGPAHAWTICQPKFCLSESTWTMANVVAPEAGPGAAEQMNAIVQKVRGVLGVLGSTFDGKRGPEDIVFTTVLLHSMADFIPMNNAYVSLFKKPNPPARVTVACGDALPSNVRVMVSFTVDLGARKQRQGLHVQSRSYWAPANIGPYSQAMSVPLQNEEQSELVYIAGQIPLEPASMDIATEGDSWIEGYCLRAVLSLQHLWRIGEAMEVDWWLGAVAFLTGGKEIQTQARVAWHLWKKIHARPEGADEDEDDDGGPQLDAWDIKYGGRAAEVIPEAVSVNLPKFSVLEEGDDCTIAPFLAVQVDELPRGSDIEWQGLGSRCEQAKLEIDQYSVATMIDGEYSYLCLEIENDQQALKDKLRFILDTHGKSENISQAVLYTTQSVSEGLWLGQVVPCRTIWGREARPLVAGVIIQKQYKSL
ncbi:hypothetical protein N7493_006402 [Penicillium malachiteum]|uniref:Diphthine--ammonia ligase n=1 Tax=Penicillium malachiteum TaxID=1324776 RepID=A0AAD6HKZ1_9EURO|nr:hypothetical protein N7493_006402 [Penicillium malachiteum]